MTVISWFAGLTTGVAILAILSRSEDRIPPAPLPIIVIFTVCASALTTLVVFHG